MARSMSCHTDNTEGAHVKEAAEFRAAAAEAREALGRYQDHLKVSAEAKGALTVALYGSRTKVEAARLALLQAAGDLTEREWSDLFTSSFGL